MGRFATTVALYEELRPPYPPAFFGRVAQQLGLASEHALIDLGTGPGLLALGFAPYVGRIVGVDPEPAMIVAARTAAARASQTLSLIARSVSSWSARSTWMWSSGPASHGHSSGNGCREQVMTRQPADEKRITVA